MQKIVVPRNTLQQMLSSHAGKTVPERKCYRWSTRDLENVLKSVELIYVPLM